MTSILFPDWSKCIALVCRLFRTRNKRHTTAVHLLNAGVDINVIRSWLGHVDLKTTNIYAEIDRETKRNALEACAYNPSKKKRRSAWKRADVLDWLEKYDPGYNVESRDDNP